MASTRRKVKSQSEIRLDHLEREITRAQEEIENRKNIARGLNSDIQNANRELNGIKNQVERLNAIRSQCESELSVKRKEISILMQQVRPANASVARCSVEESLFCSGFDIPEISLCQPLDLINQFIFGFGSRRIMLIIMNTNTIHNLFHSGVRMLTYSGIPIVGEFCVPTNRVMIVASAS